MHLQTWTVHFSVATAPDDSSQATTIAGVQENPRDWVAFLPSSAFDVRKASAPRRRYASIKKSSTMYCRVDKGYLIIFQIFGKEAHSYFCCLIVMKVCREFAYTSYFGAGSWSPATIHTRRRILLYSFQVPGKRKKHVVSEDNGLELAGNYANMVN
jgi:hypothetical protein